ncbi:Serine/threonine-protein kinase PrkC [Planctomycetes bacterium MalM25]|nr:Serine/threonine-protein kinase PrkC [Planctomycetes bacterium MalM25]
MPEPTLPVELLAVIDEVCDRFESAWREADPAEGPPCEDFVADLPDAAREAALAELFAIERQYRAARGQMASAWASGRPAIEPLASASRDEAETLAGPGPAMNPMRSGGLSVQCPHCQQRVEVLADAPLDEISCHTCGSNFGLTGSDDHPDAEPIRVGRFALRERIGVGGFGAVWRARDPELDRDVALKMPRRGQLTPHESEMFFREARAAAQLAHPGIVSVYEVGRDDGQSGGGSIYIVSELVDGEPLSDRLKAQRLTPKQAAAMLADIAEALHYAHERGVIHRDLKPSNIMLDRFATGGEIGKHGGEAFGRPRLMDFGLAKRDSGEITLTMDGQVLGTPAYMSPEQASGQVRWVDRRTDLYALGVVLFRMLTGELPYRGTATSQIQQRLTDDAPSPRRLDDSVPLDLATVCLKCLERDPNRRYDNANQVADEMRRYLAGEPVHARPLSAWGRAGRWARRRPATAAAVALGAVLAVAGPTAALVISGQNAKLQSKISENNENLARGNQKIDRLNKQLSQVTGGLTEKGPHANRLPEWRQKLIAEYLDQHGERFAEELSDDELPTEERAGGYLALGRLASEADRADEAIGHLRSAEPLLASLFVRDPVALSPYAECCELLARLLHASDEAAAKDYAARATAARRELAEAAPEDLDAAAAVLDTLSTRPAAGARMDDLERLKSFGQRLPARLDQLEAVARTLTKQD